MWLPKDERKMLRIYYERIDEPEKEEFIDENDLIKIFSPKFNANGIGGVSEYAKSKSRVATANRVLSERKLLWYREAGESVEVSLSLEGYDLARKYSSWWLFIKLWYAEYIRNHPVCVIASFVSGILITLLSQWLWSKITS